MIYFATIYLAHCPAVCCIFMIPPAFFCQPLKNAMFAWDRSTVPTYIPDQYRERARWHSLWGNSVLANILSSQSESKHMSDHRYYILISNPLPPSHNFWVLPCPSEWLQGAVISHYEMGQPFKMLHLSLLAFMKKDVTRHFQTAVLRDDLPLWICVFEGKHMFCSAVTTSHIHCCFWERTVVQISTASLLLRNHLDWFLW